MHVALLANTAWLDEELSQLHHLVVGMIDEGLQVMQVLPHGRVEGEVSAFGGRMGWTETRSTWLRRRRIGALKEAMADAEVDLLHALDGRLWWPAVDLARALDVAVVLTANAAVDVALAPRVLKAVNPARCVMVAASEPLETALRESTEGRVQVIGVPPGVHPGAVLPAEDPPMEEQSEGLCVVVSGDGRVDPEFEAFLKGAAAVVAEHPQVQVFVDGMAAGQHEVWRAASRLGLLSNLSLVPRRLGHRELLLRSDLLVLPQPLGRTRSLKLAAMSAGVPLIARADPWLDSLQDGETAWLIDTARPEAWADALRRGLTARDEARALARKAQAWVHRERLASTQVDTLINLYRHLTGAAIPFPG